MANSGNKSSFTFKRSLDIHVHVPKIEVLASLKSLDVTKLSTGKHKIEVGFVSGGCCRKLVRATVSGGMVTGFEVEHCKDSKGYPAKMSALVKEASRRVAARGTGKWKPIPLMNFVNSPQLADPGCFTICFFDVCILCCGGRCVEVPPIYTGPLTYRL